MSKKSKEDESKSNAYHHGDLQQALIDAAIDLIKEKGATALSLREVARKAGVSHGAPAHHFKDKSGLFNAIAILGFNRLKDALKCAIDQSSDDPLTRLKSAGIAYVRFAAENPAYFDVMFSPNLHRQDDERLVHAALESYQILTDSSADIEHTFQDKSKNAKDLSLRAWSTAHGLAQLWLSGNISPNFDQKSLEKAIDSVFSGGELGYISN